jgi:hypothetical protein
LSKDHFSDGLNFQCITDDTVKTRDGFSKLITFSTVRRAYDYKIYGQADRILFLDNSGSIWDSTNLVTPILSIVGMTDFAFININGFAYLSPSNGSTGLPGESLYVYLGSGTARKAAGTAPTGGGFAAANSASSGHVEAGFHIFAVAYETDTGFITALGPTLFATITATGGLSVDLTNIPTGPASTAARRIVATKVITAYNGDQSGYEFFFVPNGRIADNTTTSLTVSFFDADLFSDASYLLDLFATIPAGNHLSSYHSRLCIGGENANPSVFRVSTVGQPEAINQVSGLIQIDPANASSAITNSIQYRDALYITKKTHWYSTNDNNGDPATWQVVTLDEGIGADVHTIIPILDTGGVNQDKVLVANTAGFWGFGGSFSSLPLSWKIQDIWNRINFQAFNTVQGAVDPIAKRAYLCVPLDGATTPTHILVMDYEGIAPDLFDISNKQVRWFIWQIASAAPTSVLVRTNNSTQIPELLVGSKDGNIYKLDPTVTNDNLIAIPTPFIQTAQLPVEDDSEGAILHCAGIRLRIHGSGTLKGTLYSYDAVRSENTPDYTMSSVPGVEKLLLSLFDAEKFYLKLYTQNIDEWFKINKIRIFLNKLWDELPG